MAAHRPTTRLFVRAISVVVLLAVAVALSSWRFSVVESAYDEMYADANQGAVEGMRRRGIEAVLETTVGPSSSGCAEVASAKDQCSYLQAGNCEPDGYINYLELYYCTFSSVHIVCLALFVLLLVLLFFMLGTSAEDYFCPTLGVISDVLRLSPDVAGITILALGNGAPDVFSTFVAVTGGKFSIAIGELTGAGVFVSLVVVGAVTTVSSAKVEMLPFLRDVLFYLGASVVMLGIIITGHFYIYESALAIVVYIAYVSLSIVMNILKNRREARLKRERARRPLLERWQGHTARLRRWSEGMRSRWFRKPQRMFAPVAAFLRHVWELTRELTRVDSSSLEMPVEKPVGPAKELLLQWIARWEWSEKSILQKVVTVITFPVTIVFDITIPQVQEDTYFRLYNCASAVFSPLLLMLAFDPIVSFYGTSWAGGWIPLWACVEVGAIGVGAVVFFTTETNNLPRYNYVFVAWAFFISIVWIYLIANELVSLLEAVGLILNISPSLLGMTVLAWGNSIGDLVSNVVVAKQGAPSMAIAACFGGPLFNMLIGLGTSLTYRNILDYPNPYNVTLPTTIFNSFLFVIISMVSTLIVVPLSKFTFRRPYAIYTISLYAFYTVINLLVEFDVISDTLTIGQN